VAINKEEIKKLIPEIFRILKEKALYPKEYPEQIDKQAEDLFLNKFNEFLDKIGEIVAAI
jgi:hypothetical protein